MKNNPRRKLSAIVFKDFEEFTELSAKNESAALQLLKQQRELLKPILEDRKGVWIKEIGDCLLLTFNLGMKAVMCRIEIQKVARVFRSQ